MKREQPLKEELEEQPPRKRRRIQSEEEDDEKQQEQDEEPAPRVNVDESSDEENGEASNLEDALEAGDEALLLKEGANTNFAPCAVRSIHMKFFRGMTNLKIKPGPGTNFITGPNGSGKSSTLLALYAICGGRPEKIISGTNWDDWIMTDQDEASVRIIFHKPRPIQVPGDGRRQFGFKLNGNFVVTLRLRRGTNPVWHLKSDVGRYINMGQKKIAMFMEQLNIRWGNPCQFLPQEKVGQFANMHPKKRFEESLRTFQDGSLVAQHKLLILHTAEIQKQEEERERFLTQLEALQGKKKKMQKRLKECRERRELMLEKEALKAFKPWMDLRQFESDKKEFEEILDGYEDQIDQLNAAKQPFINAVASADKKFGDAKKRLKTVRGLVKETKKFIKDRQEKIERNRNLITREREKMKDLQKEADSSKSALVEARRELEALENDKARYFNTDQEYHKRKAAELNKQAIALNKKKLKLANEIGELRVDIRSIKNMKLRAETLIKDAEGRIKHAKKKAIGNHDIKRLYELVEKLKKSGDHFQGEVYGPIGAFIELKHKRAARAVEAKLGRKLQKGFLVSCAEDSQALRALMKVNRIEKADVYIQDKRDLPKKYGGDKSFIQSNGGVYMIDTLQAPAMIIDHLIENGWARSAIFPVGKELSKFLVSDKNKRDYNAKRLNEVFDDNWRIYARPSRFCDHVSTVSGVMRSAYILGDSFKIQAEIEEHTRVMNRHDAELEQLLPKEQELAEQYKKMTAEYNSLLRKYRGHRADSEGPILWSRMVQQAKDKIKKLESKNAQRYIDMSKRNIRTACMNLKANLCSLAAETNRLATRECFKEQYLFTKKAEAIRLKNAQDQRDEFVRSLQNNKDAKSKEQHAYLGCCKKCERQERIVNDNEEKFGELWQKLECKVKYGRATLKEDNDRLQSDIEVMSRKLAQFIDDEESMLETERKFADLENMITRMQDKVTSKNEEIERYQKKRQKIEESWLPQVRSLTKSINDSFKDMAKVFNAKGRVLLHEAANKNYGNFQIRVEMSSLKEEGDQKLRSLSGGSHSGGEQSVATMTYILALQKVSQLPFRCVDEINQGMDANNEKRIMSLVGELCAKASNEGTHPPQMFIFSPNLLRNMNWGRYRHVMTFHVIMNGPHNVIGAAEWEQEKFVQNTAQYLSQKYSQTQT